MIDDVGGYGGALGYIVNIARDDVPGVAVPTCLEPDTAELMAELPARCCLFGSTTNRIRSTAASGGAGGPARARRVYRTGTRAAPGTVATAIRYSRGGWCVSTKLKA